MSALIRVDLIFLLSFVLICDSIQNEALPLHGNLQFSQEFDWSSSPESKACPPTLKNCTCSSTKKEAAVNCRSRRFRLVPQDVPRNTTNLDLGFNVISQLTANIFIDLRLLKILRCDKNNISFIESGAFNGLEKLERLILSANPIKVLQSGTFRPLGNLRELELIGSYLTSLNVEAFVGLSNLTVLNLSKNNFTRFPSFVFDNQPVMPELRRLFAESCSLREFNISGLAKLTLLVFNDNFIENLTSEIFLPSIKLSRIYLSNCGIKEVHPNAFSGLSQLDELNLDHNRIRDFQESSLKPLTSLSALHLSNNSLTRFRGTEFGVLARLNRLYLSENNVEEFPIFLRNNVSTVPRLTYLNLKDNKIKYLQTMVNGLLNVTRLSLSGNKIDKIGDDYFSSFTQIREILLDNNPISTIDPLAFKSETLETLDLSKTRQHGRWKSMFRNAPNLTSLNVQFSGVNYSSGLTNLRKLQRLDLSFLKILSLKAVSLENTTNLLALDMTANFIVTLTREFFEPLIHLKNLTLAGNKIVTLNESSLPKRFWVNLTSIDLSENTFHCDCGLVWFRKWLNSTKVNVRHLAPHNKKYMCFSPPEMKEIPLLDVTRPTHFECFASRDVDWYIVGILLSCSIFCSASFLSAALHRYRYHVRYWKYIVTARARIEREIEAASHLKYDAFIAYSKSDLSWVTTQLIPRIESPGPNGEEALRLCVHDRDWMGGQTILDNIVESVQSSRKTILIVSNAFASSDWCHIELTMAQSRTFQDVRDGLVLVLLEQLDDRLVTPRLRSELDRRTYIEWAERSEIGQELFWLKLRRAMSRPTASALAR